MARCRAGRWAPGAHRRCSARPHPRASRAGGTAGDGAAAQRLPPLLPRVPHHLPPRRRAARPVCQPPPPERAAHAVPRVRAVVASRVGGIAAGLRCAGRRGHVASRAGAEHARAS
eukprot:3806035-Prymnesium_polylepis.1